MCAVHVTVSTCLKCNKYKTVMLEIRRRINIDKCLGGSELGMSQLFDAEITNRSKKH